MDLIPLRPRADTPDATLEAINRCTIAIGGCVAAIAKLKQERAILLMSGKPAELRQNAAALAEAISDAGEIGDLSDHLQQRMQQQAPEQLAEVAAQKWAIEAAEAASLWWTANIALVTDGLQKVGAAFAAFADLQVAVARTNAAAEAARATAVNVTPLRPHPAA